MTVKSEAVNVTTPDEVSLFGPLVPWPNRLLTLAEWDALPFD